MWRRCLEILEHPLVPVGAHGVLALGGLLQMFDTPMERALGAEIGAHHGVFGFALINMVQQLANFLTNTHSARQALKSRREASGRAEAEPVAPPDAA